MYKLSKDKFISIVFIIIIFSFMLLNSKNLYHSFKDNLVGTNFNSIKQNISKIDDNYRNNFKYRAKFIDLYGEVQTLLKKDLIGNFEFVKDDKGMLHMINDKSDLTSIKSDIKKLDELCKINDTQFLYVQEPTRIIEEYNNFPNGINDYSNLEADEIISFANENNISFIDTREFLKNSSIDKSNFYFNTDIHMKTQGELWISKLILNELEEKYGFVFDNKNEVFNENNYDIISRPFVGNFSKSSGKYYVENDEFQMYIPNFETMYELTNGDGTLIKTGTFQDVIMNGAEKALENGSDTYWVTNYLQWPNPCYKIQNKLSEGKKALVVMDSNSIRAVSYLSLLFREITVVDPRYEGSTDYISTEIANNKYDSVIMMQSNGLNKYRLFPIMLDDTSAQIISDNTPKEVKRGEKYSINITVENTSNEVWSEEQQIRLCIWQDGVDYGYRLKFPDGFKLNPSEQYTFVLNDFQAPPSNSTYVEYQMVQEGIQYFGDKKRVDIKVIE